MSMINYSYPELLFKDNEFIHIFILFIHPTINLNVYHEYFYLVPGLAKVSLSTLLPAPAGTVSKAVICRSPGKRRDHRDHVS
jgi:hypothetical protein